MVVVGDPIADPPKLTLPTESASLLITPHTALTHDEDEGRDLWDTVSLGCSDGDKVTTGSEEGEVVGQWHIGLVCDVSR